MTVFDLVKKNMRKNISRYSLYFFSMIFSIVVYYVFATLQYDQSISKVIGEELRLQGIFNASNYVLLTFIVVFIWYTNSFFIRQRKRELGLYHLVGIEKRTIGKMIFYENMLLGIFSLVVGILLGTVFSRLFVLFLLKLMGLSLSITLTFSLQAVLKTAVVFLIVTIFISFQGYFIMYRYTLLDLFQAESKSERVNKMNSKRSIVVGGLGILLVGYGYYLSSGNIVTPKFFLIVAVVLFSVIFGTFLLFKATIEWLMGLYRERASGYYSFANMLSVSTMMYRIKANARVLTLITILSATTLVSVGVTYSSYYNTKADARSMQPYDYTLHSKNAAQEFMDVLDELDIQSKQYVYHIVKHSADLSDFRFITSGYYKDREQISFLDEEEVRKNGVSVPALSANETVIFDSMAKGKVFKPSTGKTAAVQLNKSEQLALKVVKSEPLLILDSDSAGYQFVVNHDTFNKLLKAGQKQAVYVFNTDDGNKQNELTKNYHQIAKKAGESRTSYYDVFQAGLMSKGLFIFIGGFLGLVFLMATGSIIYFKQISEAEQERKRFEVLRKLGFSVSQMMSAVRKQQLFTFGLPLVIGILHSLFALKVITNLTGESLIVPVLIADAVYGIIYFFFYWLTMNYYRMVIKRL
ncbi:ABC transporter permease [Priestia megaterium]|uniref:ABC transporter permease n=1 Tax=Priestia megaterium TaxID=1404 RepID=UPI0013E34DFA|nr:ABC transporter permease [Priestia megaterium]MED3863012.1 ABC transporter permease [Priestia megaterium]MED4099459.1 ABC transporter permease [Priestia megaterium]MED4143969.1 ABC transporter permease [Priestia megaterium]MED4166779.1 ABC transporter permease [Priestia megaterium]MED4197077.1 ABC transporter permease [Priestia megaterium]